MNSETEFITQLVELYREARARMSPEELESEKTRMFNNFAYGTGNNATCQTCKHWGRKWHIYVERNYTLVNTHAVCQRITVGTRINDIVEDVAMMYEGAGDGTDFVPRFDFGCNQHEPKETEAAKENH